MVLDHLVALTCFQCLDNTAKFRVCQHSRICPGPYDDGGAWDLQDREESGQIHSGLLRKKWSWTGANYWNDLAQRDTCFIKTDSPQLHVPLQRYLIRIAMEIFKIIPVILIIKKVWETLF